MTPRSPLERGAVNAPEAEVQIDAAHAARVLESARAEVEAYAGESERGKGIRLIVDAESETAAQDAVQAEASAAAGRAAWEAQQAA